MNDLFNVPLEDDDGRVITPRDVQKHGNAFAICHLPRKGDEVHVNDTCYVVLGVIHELSETVQPPSRYV
jgi:hypothetical protein